jgi:anaerobic selenocysteine-containing dehydrogenase
VHDPALGELLPTPRARLHPATAKRIGVAGGDEVDVTGPDGVRVDGLTVVLDGHFPEGAIGVLDGLPQAPVNALRGAPSVHVAAKVRA